MAKTIKLPIYPMCSHGNGYFTCPLPHLQPDGRWPAQTQFDVEQEENSHG